MAAGDGLVSMTPTSIAHSGTSATINADGGVDFSAVTSLSLNGVFTSDYDNYLVVMRQLSSAEGTVLGFKLRVGGTDTTDSNYARQFLQAAATSVTGNRATSQSSINLFPGTTILTGHVMHIYGPALAQATAGRLVNPVSGILATLEMTDYAWTHSTATAYDGFTVTPSSDNASGNVHVFGYEE
jgi:hypothetical protein